MIDMISEKIGSLLIGASGFAATAASDTVVNAVVSPSADWLDAIIKVIIAVATLFGLFKNHRKNRNGNTKN